MEPVPTAINHEITTMRTHTSLRLLLVPAFALLAAGCDDAVSPEQPPAGDDAAPLLAGATRWAAGYLHAGSPTSASYAPVPYLAYNASGGAMNITKPAGTAGRYVVTFRGLSALLGTRSTVHVTEYGLNDTYCKPVGAYLVSDKLEVRCFKASTRAPANAAFTVLVSGPQEHRAFAYAHLSTSTNYTASASGSYNPNGSVKVFRLGVGLYKVVFTNLATATSTNSGSVQVNAVGTGTAHCKPDEWGTGGTPHLNVYVRCSLPDGALVDRRFTVLYVFPDPHVAYAYANQPSAASYTPNPRESWSPSNGGVTITRTGVGEYLVDWPGIDPHIVEGGTVQVTSDGSDSSQCKATSLFQTGTIVQCFAPNGSRVDAAYTVMLSS
jgi:hypothetical protein